MEISKLLSRDKTNALRGLAALGIVLFHIVLRYDISPIFNLWGGLFVSIFLLLGGYGLHESQKSHGLDGYWVKRLKRVVLPFAVYVCGYNLVAPGGSLHLCLQELFYIKPTYWFVFHILKCYAVYWVAMRFCGRWRWWVMGLAAVVCLNYRACGIHLESEQAFCFLGGVLISHFRERLSAIPSKRIYGGAIALFAIGATFFVLKYLPPLHQYKGTLLYNYLLCPFRTTWGLSFLLFFSLLKLEGSHVLQFVGRYSLEVYIVHIPIMEIIVDDRSTLLFFVLSLIAFAAMVGYRKWVEGRLPAVMIIYILVNALFVAKYSSRVVGEWFPAVTLAVMAIHYILIRWILPRLEGRLRLYFPLLIAGLAALCAMVALQYMVDPLTVKVDRWSALHYPIANLLHGVYPYSAQTHLGGYASPFPVWQILHIPFYLIGNVGLSLFVAMGAFLYSVKSAYGRRALLRVLWLLVAAPAVWYEATVRSDLMTNMLLVAATTNWMACRISVEWLEKNAIAIAVAIALLTCTRLLALLPLGLLLFPYYWRLSLRNKVVIPLVGIVVFVATFVPFALWDWQQFFFFKYNPWSLQTKQGYISDFLIFIPVAIVLACGWKERVGVLHRNVALMLLVFVGVSMVHRMDYNDNWDLFASAYDITYYSTALPFCLLAFAKLSDETAKNR